MTPVRALVRKPARAVPVELSEADVRDPAAWLRGRAQAHALRWLLAFSDDGVTWGRLEGDRLITSSEAASQDSEAARLCPPIRATVLREARLFGPAAELLLWRDGDGYWYARLIEDTPEDEPGTWEEAIEEPRLLLGQPDRPLAHGFTLLSTGGRGLKQVVPVAVARGAPLPRLHVRQYVAPTGLARVVAARLVDLSQATEVEEG